MNRARRPYGVTLIELLVALSIGVVLTGIAVAIFSSAQGTQRKIRALSHIQEEGRLITAVLGRDIRQADSFGCVDPSRVNTIVAGPGPNIAGPPIIGTENSGAPSVNGSDTITLRGATGFSAGVVADPPGANLRLDNVTGLAVGDVLLITDCRNQQGAGLTGDAFRATNVVAANGTVTHAAAGGANINPPQLSAAYANGTVMRVRQISYRVASGFGGVDTLQRSVDGGPWQDLSPDVHTMQIVYGEDTDADGVANRYLPADLVGNFANVVAVRVQLIVRGGAANVAGQGFTANLDAAGNQQIAFDPVFGANPVTLPNGALGQRFTITAAVRARLP